MSKERFFQPFFEGKGKYRSYLISYQEHRKGVREHNRFQAKSARNELVLQENKAVGLSRRARRREAQANPRIVG